MLPTIIYPIINSRDIENLENREMAKMPVFSFKNIESYPTEYENYYNDNLPFRSKLIRANALLNLKFFKQSPEKKVILGKDGWLFYDPPIEDSDPIGQCTGKTLSEKQLKETVKNLSTIRDILSEQGKEFIVMLCPNKESIYGEKFLPKYFDAKIKNTAGDQMAEYLQKNSDINIVYPKKQILNAIDKHPEYDFYYKLDTHWNYLGGYIGAKELLSAMDVKMPEFDNVSVKSEGGRVGDLSAMSGLPEEFEGDILYTPTGYTQNEFIWNNNTEKIQTSTTTNGDKRSVFVIRDSFSEGLYPFLNSHFSATNYIHITEYYPGSMNETNSDIVVLQVVERYLDRLTTFKIQ